MEERLIENFLLKFGTKPSKIARAPGRVELLGNHVDYNGGFVMGIGIEKYAYAAISENTNDTIEIYSENLDKSYSTSCSDYTIAEGEDSWSNYILGVYSEFEQLGLQTQKGFKLYIYSDIPAGQGLSSSAALEVCTANALCSLYNLELREQEIAKLCRRAENRFVGVPCGILDQMTSALSQAGNIVCIDCENDIARRVNFSHRLNLWVFDSCTDHALVDSSYSTRFQECAEGATALNNKFRKGKKLAQYKRQDLMEIKDSLEENIFKRALHVIEENQRVYQGEFDLNQKKFLDFGQKLFDSHNSSSELFENSTPELDFLVEALKSHSSVIGARLTGGGFGGGVIALTHPDFSEANAESVATDFDKKFKKSPTFLKLGTNASPSVIPI